MSLHSPDTPSEALQALQAQLRTPEDPSLAAPYPRGLALDLALESAPLADILEAYELSPEDMKRILLNPAFKRELEEYRDELKTDGFSFRAKAKAQAEAYLNMAWQMVHDPECPSNVRADLIKQTVRWAGHDTPVQSATLGNPITPELLGDLKSLPDGELEVRVMQVLYRRGQTAVPGETEISAQLPAIDGEVSEH